MLCRVSLPVKAHQFGAEEAGTVAILGQHLRLKLKLKLRAGRVKHHRKISSECRHLYHLMLCPTVWETTVRERDPVETQDQDLVQHNSRPPNLCLLPIGIVHVIHNRQAAVEHHLGMETFDGMMQTKDKKTTRVIVPICNKDHRSKDMSLDKFKETSQA